MTVLGLLGESLASWDYNNNLILRKRDYAWVKEVKTAIRHSVVIRIFRHDSNSFHFKTWNKNNNKIVIIGLNNNTYINLYDMLLLLLLLLSSQVSSQDLFLIDSTGTIQGLEHIGLINSPSLLFYPRSSFPQAHPTRNGGAINGQYLPCIVSLQKCTGHYEKPRNVNPGH